MTPCNNSSFMSFKVVWLHEHQLKLDLAKIILLPLPTHLQMEQPELNSWNQVGPFWQTGFLSQASIVP